MARLSWISLYPQWYSSELEALERHYPRFYVDELRLRDGALVLYGELIVRPPGGAQRFPVVMCYPEASPFEKPVVIPLDALPSRDNVGRRSNITPRFFDHRHQMPDGSLCLFQRETRADPSGDIVSGVNALRRAERWFLGTITGHWPPDSAESELEAHFYRANDVLVSETFYDDSLEAGFGKFFFVRDYRRLIDAASDDRGTCPMIMTALTIESGSVAVALDARAELARVYPWIRNETWDVTRITSAPDRNNSPLDSPEQGYWWSLPAEPRPFNNGEGMLQVLSDLMGVTDPWNLVWAQLAGGYAGTDHPVIGFRYPGRSGTPEWLMVSLPFGIQREGGVPLIELDGNKRRRFESAPVSGVRVHSVRPRVLQLRNTGVVDTEVFGKSVALIGLGALGAAVAEMLAKAGVGKIRLCDSDRLAVGNVARHVGGIHEFGASKVRVVASRLLEINPHLVFEEDDLFIGSIAYSLDQLRAFIAPADLVITTTADEGVESLINHMAILEEKPVLYARSLRRGSVGRVFLVRPGRDACKACLASVSHTGRHGGEVPIGWIDIPEGEDDVLLHECGRPVVPASAVDLTFIAALAARQGLTFLEGRDSEINHWIWSQAALPDVDSRLNRPMTTVAADIPPLQNCMICATPEIVAVDLCRDARAAIIEQVEASITAETGGILIGYVDDRRHALVLRATGPGPTSERSPWIFRRDVGFVQQELERASIDRGQRGVYLGEWHSHLEADPSPSPTDISSLAGIAQAPNYLTRSPIMVMAGLDPSDHRCETLKGWVFRLGGGMWPVDVGVTE